MPPRILSSKTCRGATGSFFTCLIRIRRSNNGLEAICELNHVLIRPEAFLLPQAFHLDYETTKLIIPGDIPNESNAYYYRGPAAYPAAPAPPRTFSGPVPTRRSAPRLAGM